MYGCVVLNIKESFEQTQLRAILSSSSSTVKCSVPPGLLQHAAGSYLPCSTGLSVNRVRSFSVLLPSACCARRLLNPPTALNGPPTEDNYSSDLQKPSSGRRKITDTSSKNKRLFLTYSLQTEETSAD